MKLNTIKTVALGLGLVVASSTLAQKGDVVNAALEYKKTGALLNNKDFEGLKKTILEAEDYIDETLEHEQTKEDPKAYFNYGRIYFDLAMYSALPGMEDLAEYGTEESLDKALKALNYAYTKPKSKYKRDVQDFIKMKTLMMTMGASQAFKDSMYVESFQAFAGIYKLKDAVLNEKDAEAKQNAQVAAGNALVQLKNSGDNKKAIKFIDDAFEIFPGDLGLATDGVQIALAEGDDEKAAEYANNAINADDKNAQTYGVLGTVYLGAGKQEKAEEYLKKAVELEPTSVDYNYNLGVLYIEQGQKLREKASKLEYGDPKANQLEEEAKATYKKAVAPLEVFLASDPNNVQVLRTLMQVSNQAGDRDKAMEFKKRIDENK